MSRITKPLRSRSAVKRLDLTDMRSLFKDRRMWSAMGIVYAPDGEEHWQVVLNEAGDSVDVIVEVELQPSQVPVTCRLPAGVWDVPDVGDEVGVILPDGEIDFMPVLVCRLSTNRVPTTQGPQPGRIVIARDEVLVHDGEGGAVSLALKQDVINVDDKYAGHLHLSPAGATEGPLSTTVANPPNPAFPGTDPVNPYLTVVGSIPTTNPDSAGDGLDAAEILGTSVLLAK